MNNTLKSKVPDALPMWISNLRRVRLNKYGYEQGDIYWGVGLPLWRYELRFDSGNKYDTLEVRAKSSRAAIKLICERDKNVQGVKEL